MKDRRPPLRARRLAALIGLATALVIPTSPALALSPAYVMSGFEIYAGVYEGVFVGTATGNRREVATWKADILHTPLSEGSPNSVITGGYAKVITSDLTVLRGDFAPGGTVVLQNRVEPCGNETFRVEGTLVDVTRDDDPSAVGTATFAGTLTHHRRNFFGYCVSYAATFKGEMGLTF